MIIGNAIYSLLSDTSISDLVNDISPDQASRTASMPYIVFSENGIPEDFKNDWSVINHFVTIDIYAAQTNAGGGGREVVSDIANAVEDKLNRYSGIVDGVQIDTITLNSIDFLYDPISEANRCIMSYKVRSRKPKDITILMINNMSLTIGSQVITI